jgi:hypothetical protein
MHKPTLALFAVALLVATPAFAKNKKSNLPAYVLTARTVAVIIDPSAGMSVEDPRANQIARADVEAELRTWGRFEVIDTQPADLIIVVRRGTGHMIQPTIHDPRQNDPIGPGGGIGPENSRPSNYPGSASNPGANNGSINDRPSPEAEIGGVNDSFVVYRGDVDRPLDTAPGWRYTATDALQPHSVPAVDRFRKAIADAEKAAQKGP